MSFYAFDQVSKESYDKITRAYYKFIANSSEPDKEPVTVFSPLSEKLLGELELIREVSMELQLKKMEDDRAKEAEEEQKKKEKEETEEEQIKVDEGAEEQNNEEKNE